MLVEEKENMITYPYLAQNNKLNASASKLLPNKMHLANFL